MFYNSPKNKHNLCAIYRGAGGAGDATGDSASEALLVRELAAEVALDAAAAEAARAAAVTAQLAAELAETNAETAETNAETAEANAETAEANAETAQAAAEAAQAAAETAQTAAELAETNAETAETNAETAATAAASSASAASTSASNAATSATNASNSATAAATSATNSANSATASATSATNASNSATAAATSATNAANSATAAQTAETNAETAEANAETAQAAAEAAQLAAETAETNAETAATNAANSASAAATSATNASNSASAASTSASNAATSATNASASEIAAAASAAAAAASYDSFDDRYLGAKSSAPTLDNDGNALIAGALYYNDGTVTAGDKGMYVYDGSQWIAASAASTAILVVYKYTATSGQTTFSGNDDNAVALAYTAGSIIVTLNGVVLESGSEYTATTGTSVVLTTGAATGDELNIHAFSTFDIANVYTQSQANAKFFDVTGDSISGNLTFTGTGNRITGDFSSSPVSNRVAFQTSTTDGSTTVAAIPNGTSTLSVLRAYAASDLTNATYGDLVVQSTTVDLRSTRHGTGTFVPLTFHTGGSERLRIDTNGNLGIGTSSPTSGRALTLNNASNYFGINFQVAGTTVAQFIQESTGNLYIDSNVNNATGGTIFRTNGSERMRIDSSGNVGIGTSTTTQRLNIGGEQIIIASSSGLGVRMAFESTATNGRNWQIGSNFSTGNGEFAFYDATASAERMRIDSAGNLFVGRTAISGFTSEKGFGFLDGQGITIGKNASPNLSSCLYMNRMAAVGDGALVEFAESNTVEGSISVSGTTVSYNGGHLSRYAQTLSSKDDSILKGTVLSNLDEMNTYIDADGNPVENEQLNKVKVSDVEADVNVAGVFVNWSHDNQHNVDEINMAMTGDMIIRIAQGVTVQRGDLLMSAGDGTAKPQGDDIVRSKTIAKVTSTNITCTYADGSYCVPCVLMAC